MKSNGDGRPDQPRKKDEGSPGNAGEFAARGRPEAPMDIIRPINPLLEKVLESAARLQELVPDAVLVGGSAAAAYAGHRHSTDHDHVLMDLADRFDAVLDALDEDGAWVTNRVVPNKLILGELGGIEAGVRQLIRKVPLETQEEQMPSGAVVTVPTADETLRIKAYLIVSRNQTRDFLDVAALSDRYGIQYSADVLRRIDAFYTDPSIPGAPVATQVARQLGNPQPKDTKAMQRLRQLKGLDHRWYDWDAIADQCKQVAIRML